MHVPSVASGVLRERLGGRVGRIGRNSHHCPRPAMPPRLWEHCAEAFRHRICESRAAGPSKMRQNGRLHPPETEPRC